jgi:transcriptional regulator with XRE-family HTH domain
MGEIFMFINKTADGRNNLCGLKIAVLRKQRSLSQRELADLIGAAAPNVSYWCNGVTVPTIYKLIDICNAMQVSMDRLLKRREIANDQA